MYLLCIKIEKDMQTEGIELGGGAVKIEKGRLFYLKVEQL